MDGTCIIMIVAVIIVLVAIFIGVNSLDKRSKKKAEEKAFNTLQTVLNPGEKLIGITEAGTKGPSQSTVLLTGVIGAAISRAGNIKFYVGLSDQRLILLPVNANTSNQNLQEIPVTDIKSIVVKPGMWGSSTFTVTMPDEELVVYVSDTHQWVLQAIALQNAFNNRSAT